MINVRDELNVRNMKLSFMKGLSIQTLTNNDFTDLIEYIYSVDENYRNENIILNRD